MFNETMAPSLSDIAAVTGRNNDGDSWGNGNGWWVLIILFAIFGGWGNRGWGNEGNQGGYGMQGVPENYALATDFATIERKLDGVNNGLCEGFYNTAQMISNTSAAAQNTMTQGFAGINTAIVSQGYETRLGTQQLSAQLAQCCCDELQAIGDNKVQGIMNTNALQAQIQQCCCDNEKMQMQSRFDAQQYNCNTLQAIDKLGDRIIDHMTCQETQRLRDENQALKFAASQFNQNQYLTDKLRPCPIPAYQTCNPWAASQPYGSCCSVGCGC